MKGVKKVKRGKESEKVLSQPFFIPFCPFTHFIIKFAMRCTDLVYSHLQYITEIKLTIDNPLQTSFK